MRAGLDELTVEFEQDGAEIRSGIWGNMHVARYVFPPGMDLSPFFAMLPDGLCSGGHFGAVLEGEIVVRYQDGSEETSQAGDLYYWPAGHTAWTGPGVVFVAVTPLEEVERMAAQMAVAAG